MLDGGGVILDAASVGARIRDPNIQDAERAREVVILADGDALRAGADGRVGAGDSQRQAVLEPGKVQRKISGGDDALNAGPVVHVQVLGEGKWRDFGRHCVA